MYFSKKYVNQDDNYQLSKTIKEMETKAKENKTITESSEINDHINKINNTKISNHTREVLRAKAYTSLMEAYFIRGLANAYTKALPLDEGSIDESVLIKYFEESLHENNVNISDMILKNRNNNKFLNTLYEDSKYLAGKNSDKLAEKQDLTKESINDFLNDNKDEDDKIMNNNEFNEDELSDVVKDKVIETIKQEQEYAKKIKEEDDEIDKLKEKNEDVRIDRGIEQHSLFKSIMISSAKNNSINEDTSETSLCDAICEYTRLELFNTLNISSHTTSEIKNICESMLIDSSTSLIY